MNKYSITNFPPQGLQEDKRILAKLIEAKSNLRFLDGLQHALPNPEIILNTLPLQEARDSSAIENIVSSNDDLYKHRLEERSIPPAIKEVRLYVAGMNRAVANLRQEQNLISQQNIKEIQAIIVPDKAGYRKKGRAVIWNPTTAEVVYKPPQEHQEIIKLMAALEEYINSNNSYDPLIKMALIHHQFESIHPFPDGNGRTGRILNLLFLLKEKQLSRPVLYLSRFINHNRGDYYRLLQQVNQECAWAEWVIYMLTAIAKTSEHTVNLIESIMKQYSADRNSIQQNYKRLYSRDLLNHLYANPYTKVKYLQEELDISRPTAVSYLDQLTIGGILQRIREGREDYYLNYRLARILFESPTLATDCDA